MTVGTTSDATTTEAACAICPGFAAVASVGRFLSERPVVPVAVGAPLPVPDPAALLASGPATVGANSAASVAA
ncbi:MAG: hypothetical protein KGQ82_10775, partial [Alphaproteobacteria bacterium]|nr:hypothetical protein [Alphaproteobacteria bacterium]